MIHMLQCEAEKDLFPDASISYTTDYRNEVRVKLQLENKLPSIKVRPTTLAYPKTLTLTFNPMRAMVMNYSHKKGANAVCNDPQCVQLCIQQV